MTKLLTSAAAVAALFAITGPALATVQVGDFEPGAVVTVSEDIPVWGPLRGHANPQCPRHTVCPKPTIFY